MRLTGRGLSKAGAVGFVLYLLVLLHHRPAQQDAHARSEDTVYLEELSTNVPHVEEEAVPLETHVERSSREERNNDSALGTGSGVQLLAGQQVNRMREYARIVSHGDS
eukprot:6642910-Pyramimonas_sp.AAC.4